MHNRPFTPHFALRACMALALMVLGFDVAAQFSRRGASKEIAFQLGSAWYTGDLNPTNMFRGMSHVSQGAFYRHNLNSRFSLRGQYLRGMIEMWDADHPNAWQQERNLHFRNDLREYALLGELNYRDHVVGRPIQRLVPFLFAGIAVYTHDPEAQDRLGNWQPLQPLGTEGQGWFEEVENYLNWGVAVPYGIGIKGTLGEAMSLQLEWGARKVWTDYLDDVSTVFMNPSLLREARGQTAVEFADRAEERELAVGQSIAGLQRGDPGRPDRYGYFLVSLGFRVSKKATTCWEQ